MEPTTLSLLSTAASVVGSLMSASSQSSAANYRAQIAQQNADITRQQSAAALQAQQRQQTLALGQITANYGASGVSSDAGSPLDVLQDSVRQAKLDNLTTQYNYDLKAQGYQNQANLADYESGSYLTSGLLTAAGAAAKGYGDYQKLKPPTPGNKIAGVSADYNPTAGWM